MSGVQLTTNFTRRMLPGHGAAPHVAIVSFWAPHAGSPGPDRMAFWTRLHASIAHVRTKSREKETRGTGRSGMHDFANLPSLRRKFEKTELNQRFLADNGVYPECCKSDDAAAVVAVMRGQGLLLLGAPGVGKTHLLRDIIVSLKEAGRRVDYIAKTHMATKNLGSDVTTADSWVRRHVRAGGCHCHVLVVEELSQIDVQLWADLAPVRFKGKAFICCGDLGQFQAVSESWAKSTVPEGALQDSHMQLEMCDANRLTLTENKRSDEKLAFYTGLRCVTEEARDLQEALTEARQLFPKTELQADHTRTMSHKRRNQPQSMWLWPGQQQLIGAGGKCLKGLFYSVLEVTEDTVALEDQTLTHQKAVRSLRLAHALTHASCQGLTLRGRVRLETESPNMTLRHLYVGISRATAASLVEVV
ncbi:unnamed protein product [Polarella glacialis]|uniref:ATP-dependent DNA helicase n=1 Tax=Polarella glacialis TaxID=89957 RepID=A0A813K5X2_POLGL|nr:unnamed protein product [Polarella glacialis]